MGSEISSGEDLISSVAVLGLCPPRERTGYKFQSLQNSLSLMSAKASSSNPRYPICLVSRHDIIAERMLGLPKAY